jgi:acetoacetyl-CoA synthetase
MYLYSVSGLLSGARSILYDGSPNYPSKISFLNMLADLQVTHFGTSAHYLSLLEQADIKQSMFRALDRLQVITSTGSVLTEPQYYWVYKTFGPVQLSSIAGGTDIAGACKPSISSQILTMMLTSLPVVGGAPNLPVYAGWCQARTLGMKVQIFSDDGKAIESTGKSGELVCTGPFPSQPVFFWGDHNGKRYHAAYFEMFPGNYPCLQLKHATLTRTGIWHQGDFIRMDPTTQGIQFLGRSDGVLNPSGTHPVLAILLPYLIEIYQVSDLAVPRSTIVSMPSQR